MELKDQILRVLEDNKGRYVSGSQLSGALFVSRNAVWKAVNALRADGHIIDAVTNKGYCLSTDSDVLSAAAIEKHFAAFSAPFQFEVFKSLGSTNTYLKDLAAHGAPEGTVAVAEKQTGGRGRLGRDFHSPAGTGIYFSLLLRPDATAADAPLITTAAAVAVARAVEAHCGGKATIKWVNDVYYNGKKISGILTEGAFNAENGGMYYAVLGIGVNIAPPPGGFPSALDKVAGTLCPSTDSFGLRSRLIADILKNFWPYYRRLSEKTFLNEYRDRSFLLGMDVNVHAHGTIRHAHALRIDDACHLIVRFADGTVEALGSGEVSVRPYEGDSA